MNLMINNYCNLHCSYCFAQETMGSSKAQNITLENFKLYLDWLKKNDIRQVRLIGGEPTLHPQLELLIDTIIEYDFFENILLFSNMTFKPEITDMIIRKSKLIDIRFLPNINDFNLIIPSYKKTITYNLDVLSIALPYFDTIGINIYSPEQDLSLWEEIICKYNIKRLRFSIVLPNKAVEDDFDFYEYFHSFQPLLLRLSEISVKYKVRLCNDCNSLPICCYDDWAITELVKACPDIFEHTYCNNPAEDVLIDLTVITCFVTGWHNDKKLTDFKDPREVDEYVNELRKQKQDYIIREECRDCSRYKMHNAPCSCLSYRKIKK